ncbi:MAG: acyl carrier protein [Burkholderiaceae bacterium]|nr:acyl carrier protein [Burkholderiaceae bacterium]
MDVVAEVIRILEEVLGMGGRMSSFTRETNLLGAVPQLDSMAVVTLITTLEERLSIAISDDEIDGDTFATVESLAEFVRKKVGG